MQQNASKPTPNPAGHIKVAREGDSVLLKVCGLGNMNICYTMRDFVKACLEAGYRHFALDLGECSGMDSTFMGTIVGILGYIEDREGWLCLLNVAESNIDLLKLTGVWGLVTVKNTFILEDVETECLMPFESSAKRIKLIKKAHENLVAIDERNVAKFGAFLAGLNAEMNTSDSADNVEEEDDDEYGPPQKDSWTRDSERWYRLKQAAKNNPKVDDDLEPK